MKGLLVALGAGALAGGTFYIGFMTALGAVSRGVAGVYRWRETRRERTGVAR